MDPDLETACLHEMIDEYRAGNIQAMDNLIRQTMGRLQVLATAMLREYPQVQAREEREDVLQNALLRLIRALREVTPASVRDYYRLAAEQLRRELRDLARWHARRPAGSLSSPTPGDDSLSGEVTIQLPDPGGSDLDRWAAFHEAVMELPPLLREVFALTFYHGWTQGQIGGLMKISERHVRRLWIQASSHIRAALKENM